MKTLFVILSLVLLCSCISQELGETPPAPKITNRQIGKWVNIHIDNPDLVGVRVQQFPDCQYDVKRYEGKHPSLVIYVFRNGKAHQMGYEPDGRVTSGFWWDAPTNHWIWKGLDTNLPKE